MKRPFHVCHCGDHAFIPTTRGFVALVNPEDASALAKWNWSANVTSNQVYAQRKQRNKKILMHRAIMNAAPAEEIDHANGNGLDNQRRNLRFCTRPQNNTNARAQANKSSRFKGVILQDGYWRAKINKKHIGLFKTEVEAAEAYDRAAKEAFGEFARINFPSGS